MRKPVSERSTAGGRASIVIRRTNNAEPRNVAALTAPMPPIPIAENSVAPIAGPARRASSPLEPLIALAVTSWS